MNRFFHLRYPLILIATAAIIYGPTLNYPFLWDDAELIANNAQFFSLQNLSTILTGGFLQSLTNDTHTIPFFRPVSLLFLFIERHLFGDAVVCYRIIHCGIHLTTAILLYVLLVRVFSRVTNSEASSDADFVSFAGVLFFLSIPYTVDAVVFLTNIGDVLVLNLIMWTLLLNDIYIHQRKKLAFAGAVLFLGTAFFCKETAIPLVIAPVLFNLCKPNSIPKIQTYILSITTFPILIVYFVLRASSVQAATGLPLLQTIQNFPAMFWVALRWALFPHQLALMEPVPQSGFIVLTWVPFIFLTVAFIYLSINHNLIGIAVSFWTVAIAPSIAASYIVHFFSPRYLYVPSFGLVVAFSWLLSKTSTRLRRVVLLLPALLMLFSLIRADVWKSNYSLWRTETLLHPENALALINLGIELEVMNEPQKAIDVLTTASRIAKENKTASLESLALEKIGIIQLETYGASDDAEQTLKSSIDLYPQFRTWLVLGRLYAEKKRNFAQALHAFSEANKLKGNQFDVLINMAGALGGLHRFNEAYQYLDQAQSLAFSDKQQKELGIRRRTILSYETRLRKQGMK